MPELRNDWLTGRSVFVAENRLLRPDEFASEPASAGRLVVPNTAPLSTCPLCAGNEHLTPPALYQQLDAQNQWQTRVVPNMFPAVTLDNGAVSSPAASPAIGAHEVIIESAAHRDRMSTLTEHELRGVLETYAQRLNHWRDDGGLAYGMVFKNQGPRAGASLAHLHSQLIALPAVPPTAEAELRRADEDFQKRGGCTYCRLIAAERAAGERIVFDRDGYVAFCPYVSWQPHEVWIMPTSHEPSFELAARDRGLAQLANVVKPLIDRLESLVPQAAYNLLLRTAPWRLDCASWFHWRLELLPRSNSFAGLEIGTGIHINPLPPERAARDLCKM